MRFCVVGAGAIGSAVAARLALAGNEVTVVARGRNLDALRSRGLAVREADGTEKVAKVRAEADTRAAGPHDVAILAVKAHQLAAVVPQVAPLLHADTAVVPMQNGIPFWYFHEHPGAFKGRTIEAVDPGGATLRGIPAERVIGCVVYLASELVAPATVSHRANGRLIIGELDGRRTPRIEALSKAMSQDGFAAPVTDDIRSQVWIKLWGNSTFNPISALTHTTLADITRDPFGRDLAAQMMAEARAVGEKLGAVYDITPDERLAQAGRVGPHKTSMLQDVEAGRALEIDALVGSVVELGKLAGVPTPTIATLYRAAKLLDRNLAERKVRLRAEAMPAA